MILYFVPICAVLELLQFFQSSKFSTTNCTYWQLFVIFYSITWNYQINRSATPLNFPYDQNSRRLMETFIYFIRKWSHNTIFRKIFVLLSKKKSPFNKMLLLFLDNQVWPSLWTHILRLCVAGMRMMPALRQNDRHSYVFSVRFSSAALFWVLFDSSLQRMVKKEGWRQKEGEEENERFGGAGLAYNTYTDETFFRVYSLLVYYFFCFFVCARLENCMIPIINQNLW